MGRHSSYCTQHGITDSRHNRTMSKLDLGNIADLPAPVQQQLRGFLSSAITAFGEDLVSLILFGSAAEGRLRAASDVNLLLVTKRFGGAQAAQLEGPLNAGRVAVKLHVMFLEHGEIDAATECFAQKFADILRRRRLLYGIDPFAGKTVPRHAEILRTRQVLLNLTLRMRERYTLEVRRPDRLVEAILESVGPLRSCAAAVLELEGLTLQSPREAFANVVASAKAEWSYLPTYLSDAREGKVSATPPVESVLTDLIGLATAMRTRVERLS